MLLIILTAGVLGTIHKLIDSYIHSFKNIWVNFQVFLNRTCTPGVFDYIIVLVTLVKLNTIPESSDFVDETEK